MPTLIARGCSPELATRVRAYARQHPERSTSDSIAALLAIALDHLEARVRAGMARHADTTPAERSESARAAAVARWGHR